MNALQIVQELLRAVGSMIHAHDRVQELSKEYGWLDEVVVIDGRPTRTASVAQLAEHRQLCRTVDKNWEEEWQAVQRSVKELTDAPADVRAVATALAKWVGGTNPRHPHRLDDVRRSEASAAIAQLETFERQERERLRPRIANAQAAPVVIPSAPPAQELPPQDLLVVLPCWQLANQSYDRAISAGAPTETLKAVYDWLKEHDRDEYHLPALATWEKYLRAYRNAMSGPANAPRKARTGRSVVAVKRI